MDKDCGDLGILFQETIGDIKASFSLYDEFTNKAVKLNSAIKLTIAASMAFHETFFKLAETANGTRGASKDIGIVLSKLCSRRQAVELKLKAYAMSLIDLLVIPIQKSLDDWSKAVAQLDKDRNRDHKKAYSELKKASGETIRLQKKFNKGKTNQGQLDEAIRDAGAKYAALEETEKRSVVSALQEERSHLCLLLSCLKPVLDHEIAMLSEVDHLQEIADNLAGLSDSGSFLPPVAEQLISDAVQGQLSPHVADNKKKSSKEDMRIEVVGGTLKSTGDLMHLTDVPPPPCSPSMPPQLHASPPSEAFVKRSKSIQASCHSNLRIQHLDTGMMAAGSIDRQVPYESCQSLQCSSGYGTMTNISTSSVEAAESPGVYEILPDGLPACDIPRQNKYCTLPNKRPLFTGLQRNATCKPSSTGLQDMFAGGRHYTEASDGPDINRSTAMPPMPIRRQPAFVDSDDDFPLPPPPEELLYPMEGQSYQESPYQRKPSNAHPVQTDVIQHLNAALSGRKFTRQDSDVNRASNWSDKSSGYSASGDADDEEDCSFARQLKGVRLKRAESHDRSAPRLQKL